MPYSAEFEAVEGATGYLGVITRSDGSVTDEFRLQNLGGEPAGEILSFNTGVGSVIIINGCDRADIEQQASDLIPQIEPVSIRLTPIF